MNKKPILVVGSLNMDLVVTTPKLPAMGETVFGKTFATFPGGKGANQAVAAAKLGAAVSLVGCVGKDDFGNALVASLVKNQVKADFIRRVEESTGTALITVGNSGTNTIVIVPGANSACSSQNVDQALKAFDQPGILVIQHEIPAATVDHAVKAAKNMGWKVILNPAPARPINEETLAFVDIITPNETEVTAITGIPVHDKECALQATRKLLAAGVGTVVITMGGQGAIYGTSDEIRHISAVPVQAVDTTAAGDAYTGALATALTEGKNLEASLQFAANVAAIAVTREGAQPAMPWRHEVEAFITQQEAKA